MSNVYGEVSLSGTGLAPLSNLDISIRSLILSAKVRMTQINNEHEEHSDWGAVAGDLEELVNTMHNELLEILDNDN